MGLRSPIFLAVECCGRGGLARESGYDHRLSPNYAGGLRAGLSASQLTSDGFWLSRSRARSPNTWRKSICRIRKPGAILTRRREAPTGQSPYFLRLAGCFRNLRLATVALLPLFPVG